MLSEEELRGIEERAKKASWGPWELRPSGSIIGHKDTAAVAYPGAFDWICSMQSSNQPMWYEDGQFIAHAREDIPALLATIRESRERVGRLQNTVLSNIEEIQTLKARVKELEDELRAERNAGA